MGYRIYECGDHLPHGSRDLLLEDISENEARVALCALNKVGFGPDRVGIFCKGPISLKAEGSDTRLYVGEEPVHCGQFIELRTWADDGEYEEA